MQGTVIDNRYTLVEPLGGGGMATVYLAHDEVLDRDVALKMLREQYAGDEEFVERFRREAQSAAKLSHPNIVSIYDRGRSEDGAYYIAMEYVSRGTLKERIKRDGALDPGVATDVALQIADALQAAHENGVVHRDIKPQNVLVTRTGDVKVTDFGIARAASSPLTQTSAVLGTAGYMSPEQTRGEKVGPASDLYSLGVVLYEMLTGTLPYIADNPVAQAMMHINEPPRSPRGANPNVPEALDAVTLKLLAKNPKARYASAAKLADDLDRVRSGLPPAVVDAQKTTAAMAAPLPPLPTAPATPTQERTAKTAVRPPIVPPPRTSGPGGGRLSRLPRVLGALLLGAILLTGLAWALTSLLSESGDPGGKSSEQEQKQTPAPSPSAPDKAGGVVPDASASGEDVSGGSVPDSGASGGVVQAPPQAAPVPPEPAPMPPEPAPVAQPVPVPAPAPVAKDKPDKPKNEQKQKSEGKKGKDKQKGIVGEDGDKEGDEGKEDEA